VSKIQKVKNVRLETVE